MKNTVRILNRATHKLGIVTTPRGLVYACTWSWDTELTPEIVREVWRTDRKAFRAYDESAGHYVGGVRS